MVLEMARGWLLSGFPWLLVGASQTDTPLAGLAPLLGVYGVGWGVALLAGLIQVAVTGAGQTRRSAIIGMMLLMALSSTLSQRQWSRPAGSPFKVTLLQGNIPQDAKWQQQNRLPTLQMYIDLTRQHWDSKLITGIQNSSSGPRRRCRCSIIRFATVSSRHWQPRRASTAAMC
jgi:apolipoprotein N-acyltransferase